MGCVACPSFSPLCYLTKRGGNHGQALASSLPECLKRAATSVTEGLWAVLSGKFSCYAKELESRQKLLQVLRKGMGREWLLSGSVPKTPKTGNNYIKSQCSGQG